MIAIIASPSTDSGLRARKIAGSQAGIWPGMEEFSRTWTRERRFQPAMDADLRARKIAGWKDAVRRTLTG